MPDVVEVFQGHESLGELEQQEQQLLKEEYFEELAAIRALARQRFKKQRIYFQKYRIDGSAWSYGKRVARAAAAERGRSSEIGIPQTRCCNLNLGRTLWFDKGLLLQARCVSRYYILPDQCVAYYCLSANMKCKEMKMIFLLLLYCTSWFKMFLPISSHERRLERSL